MAVSVEQAEKTSAAPRTVRKNKDFNFIMASTLITALRFMGLHF
jgi:hypothetical protein